MRWFISQFVLNRRNLIFFSEKTDYERGRFKSLSLYDFNFSRLLISNDLLINKLLDSGCHSARGMLQR